ncbi:HAD family phosphatase [Hyunsoonleella sp. SJ7]|uniref:HAD family phosphatase n=1 Tax=Hyunsoonleella aquatilis TaxID=2762758 RepID=A0A923HK32_9FLAO|nr:HAD family phosphatase [Hyunsoonleella aquatilis]MBC3759752.1 HAD family phosphatase [Hyunsoonleella aquatilis]
MIKTIVFDFGNVFIDLDIETAFQVTLEKLGISTLPEDIIEINKEYEIGNVSTENFVRFYAEKFPHLNRTELVDLWNLILKDFPKYRLDFLKQLKDKGKYQLILLSNTNELHIDWVKAHVSFYKEFKNCFHQFYLSHEIHLRKPNKDIFEFVLQENQLKPNECVFVDDNANNIETAKTIGIHTWHIRPVVDDVVDLFSLKSHLF